jgi:predicted DNA-binding protein YlxM (UPF0122 family)
LGKGGDEMAKVTLLSFADSNMSGYVWRWSFYLETEGSGGYKLSCEQLIIEGDEDDEEGLFLASVSGLKRGADIYGALESLVSEAGYCLEDFDLTEVAGNIEEFNATLADQFKRGEELLERRERAARKRAEIERTKKLDIFKKTIDEYVLRFSDTPLRYPGGGSYGTQRIWARHFIEQYILDNGQLPTGEHKISATHRGSSYSGSTHDFSDLKLKW